MFSNLFFGTFDCFFAIKLEPLGSLLIACVSVKDLMIYQYTLLPENDLQMNYLCHCAIV